MDGAVILGAGVEPEYVADILRGEEVFLHVASSIAASGGRGRDFDGGVRRRTPFEKVLCEAEEMLSPAGPFR